MFPDLPRSLRVDAMVLAVRLLREMMLLGSETITIWLQVFTRLTFWCALGLTGALLGLFGSSALGATNQILSLTVFVSGVLIKIVCLIMMLHTARDALQAPPQLRRAQPAGIPDTVFQSSTASTTLLAATGPFLLTYSLWGLVEQELTQLFGMNLVMHGTATENWSIGMDRWEYFLGVAVVVFVLKQALQTLADTVLRRRTRTRTALNTVVLGMEGLWVFAAFVVASALGAELVPWMMRRTIVVALTDRWYDFLDALPTITLPLGVSLDTLLHESLPWLLEVFLPAAADYIALPLFWLALTAVVHGWRRFRLSDVMHGRSERRLSRMETGLLGMLTKDAREKYLPVLTCLRLVVKTGPHFVGAYLILAAIGQFAQANLVWTIQQLVGPRSDAILVSVNQVVHQSAELLVLPLLSALYLAAFDRSVSDATGADWKHRPLVTTSRTPHAPKAPVTGVGADPVARHAPADAGSLTTRSHEDAAGNRWPPR